MENYIKLRGGKPLVGEISIKGAKNTLPKNMVAALLTDEPSIIRNVSKVEDVELMIKIIEGMGGEVEWIGDDTIKIYPEKIKLLKVEEMARFAGKSRIPVLLCGPCINRFGKAVVPILGGCKIGPRPINFHLDALKQLGAEIRASNTSVVIKANRLKGAKIKLDYPSVGATEQVLLSSVLAEGKTVLSNAAVEPEVIDLVAVLQKMGAIISVETDRVIRISGVEKLHGYDHFALPDRLEAASWACAAAATNGKITVKGARQLDMMTFLNKFREVGGGYKISDNKITFYREKSTLKPTFIETDVHPGFMTDWQQPFVVLLTQAEGMSVVHETVYENRFGYIDTLNKMGAKIQLFRDCLGSIECRFEQRNYEHSAVIAGPTELSGTNIEVPDLRGGFSYIIAALVAQGVSEITNLKTIGRGYENFVEKLHSLGAAIVEAK